MPSVLLGADGELAYKAGGVAGGGEFTVAANVRDVTLNLSKGEADVTTRGNGGWKATKATLKDMSLEFSFIWNTEDPFAAALRNAWLNDTIIGIRALDQPGGEGPQADCDVFGFTKNEALEEGQSVSVTLKPTYSATAPTWVEAAGGESSDSSGS